MYFVRCTHAIFPRCVRLVPSSRRRVSATENQPVINAVSASSGHLFIRTTVRQCVPRIRASVYAQPRRDRISKLVRCAASAISMVHLNPSPLNPTISFVIILPARTGRRCCTVPPFALNARITCTHRWKDHSLAWYVYTRRAARANSASVPVVQQVEGRRAFGSFVTSIPA